MKDELKRKIMEQFVELRAKTYSYLRDDSIEDKKSKRPKKMCHKKKHFKFKDYKNCLTATQLKNKINQP